MSLLQMSFSGAILILTIMVIRLLAINKLPKKTFLFLWGIVILRLLLPISIPSVWSVYSFFNQNVSEHTLNGIPMENVIPIAPREPFIPHNETPTLPAEHVSHISVWSIVWCVGMVLCFAFFIISYLRCRFEFQTSIPVQNDFTERWLKKHPLRRSISIRQSDRVSTPLTYGFFHPVILMPKKTNWENTKQLEYILLHEYVHICRYDALTKLISTVALCIHWFNPFVWIMYTLVNRDMELACDERVVRRFGETSKSAYAMTLIDMAAKQSSLTPLCNNFSKNAIEERITAIMKTRKKSLLTLLTGALLITAVTTACATSAPNTKNETEAKSEVSTETENPEVSNTAAVILPLYPLESAQEALADGGYAVSFTVDDLTKSEKGYDLTVEVYEYDRYEIEPIEKLKAGSNIQFCKETITVDTIEKDEKTGSIYINGGFEKDGFALIEEDGLYRTTTADGNPAYYSVGKVTIPISPEMTLEDHANPKNEPDGEITQYKDLPESLQNSKTPFDYIDTIITVRQEQIVQIIRYGASAQ